MRKKSLRVLALTLALSTVMSVPAFAESATVTGSYVNMRKGPGMGYGVVKSLPRGTSVNVTDMSNSSWYAVEYMGYTGFMSSDWLNVSYDAYLGGSGGSYSSGSYGTNAYINAMYVRFRSGPGSGYSVLTEYNKGKAVCVTATEGEWTACVIDGRQGYVHSAYISYGTYSAGGSGSGVDIYSDSYRPSPTPAPVIPDRLTPVTTGTPVLTPNPGYTPVQTPAPTLNPVQTPAPTLRPAATPAPTLIPVATATPAPVPTTPVIQDSGEGFVNANYVRLRSGAGTSYPIIDSYNWGTRLTITGRAGDWLACEINGMAGFIHSQYVTRVSNAGVTAPVTTAAPTPTPVPVQTVSPTASPAPVQTAAPTATPVPTPIPTPVPTPTPAPTVTPVETKAGYVCGSSVRMRSGASMNASIITELGYGTAVTITGTIGDWTEVTYQGTKGYIYSQYVTEGTYTPEQETPNYSESATGSELGQKIANFALQYVGYKYSWGGTSPDTGFDCSGLVYYTYKQFGYNLNRVACDQAKNGVHVDELQAGDILCFYSSGDYIGHVGIYIGDGKFVHAQNSATGVVISSLDGYYGTRGYEARRIV